ncbi:Bug family tripartite tricarboxylate transporter substrate binding protein [Pseudoroseomonas globiformis]|uniref:Bug family tripartite tricarboxylate transporter substrate binding protein n=1 Tax=Teichococcus globiformis TaxID=2307229 RepID=A0ABV7FW28_9PROT
MSMISRRTLAAVGAGALTLQNAAAQSYPSRPIRWILGFGAGGVGDLIARLVAPRISEGLGGQPLVIENRPSAGGIVAAEAVARAEPDGYTLLLVTTTTATAAAMYRALPFDTIRDFTFVGQLAVFEHVIATAADGPYKNLRGLIAAARERPGRINLGSIGVGSAQHLSVELFKSVAGIEATVVNYRSTPELINAIATGEVQAGFETLAPVMPQLGGRLRGLAIPAPVRFSGLPQVPTTAEEGLPDYVIRSWNGICAPAGLPPGIAERLNRELIRVAAMPDVQNRLRELGVEPMSGPPDALRDLMKAEIARYDGIVAKAGIERL